MKARLPEPRREPRAAVARGQRGAREHDRDRRGPAASPWRRIGFVVVTAAILGVGGYLAFGDFLGRPGASAGGGGESIGIRASMAGFTPQEIRVRAGETVSLDFWTRDASPHLENGVHTLISHELGLHVELPGADLVSESRVPVSFTAPTMPGRYDIYCDTCCGGRENPRMHGTIVVEA